MNPAELIGLIGVIVAVLVGVAAILATRRWGNRRNKLMFTWESVPMLPVESAGGLLQVTYRDFPIPEPHLVTVRMINVGPNDVATKHFDGGASLRIELNCTMFGLLRSSHPAKTASRSIGSDAVVELRPSLLRKGDEWRVDIVVGNRPDPKVKSSLIDTDITEGRSSIESAIELLSGLTISLPFGIGLHIPSRTDK